MKDLKRVKILKLKVSEVEKEVELQTEKVNPAIEDDGSFYINWMNRQSIYLEAI